MGCASIIGRGVEVRSDTGEHAMLGVVYRCERTPVGLRYHVAGNQRRVMAARSQLRVLDEPWPHAWKRDDDEQLAATTEVGP